MNMKIYLKNLQACNGYHVSQSDVIEGDNIFLQYIKENTLRRACFVF